MLIDTHAHIYLEEFENDIDEVIQRARHSGVEKILLPNIDSQTIEQMLSLENKYSGTCYSMIGLHPCSVKQDFMEELNKVEHWLSKRKFLAIGEIGTDLYWDKTFWEEQKEAFITQCEWAIQYNLPVAVHCRNSIDETIELVDAFSEKGLRGVFHCFTGTLDQAEKITDMGFFLGIGGVVTFKNGGIDKILHSIDRERIILETDSPYLSPAPERGKRNEPSKVALVVKKVAECLDLTDEQVTDLTTKNANDLFFK
ncbi:MAG: TatD family hydrolase [Cyclobacteriaceae bacterium]